MGAAHHAKDHRQSLAVHVTAHSNGISSSSGGSGFFAGSGLSARMLFSRCLTAALTSCCGATAAAYSGDLAILSRTQDGNSSYSNCRNGRSASENPTTGLAGDIRSAIALGFRIIEVTLA